jgi:hypothetical protein
MRGSTFHRGSPELDGFDTIKLAEPRAATTAQKGAQNASLDAADRPVAQHPRL